MDVYLVIYTTETKTIYRLVSNRNYSIGKSNSYGWYIVDLQILYINKFIKIDTYKDIINIYRISQNSKKKKKKKLLRILELLHKTFN